MKKKIGKYEFEFEVGKVDAIGLAFVIGNHQPKRKYKTALWEIAIFTLCFEISIEWSYTYKQ